MSPPSLPSMCAHTSDMHTRTRGHCIRSAPSHTINTQGRSGRSPGLEPGCLADVDVHKTYTDVHVCVINGMETKSNTPTGLD